MRIRQENLTLCQCGIQKSGKFVTHYTNFVPDHYEAVYLKAAGITTHDRPYSGLTVSAVQLIPAVDMAVTAELQSGCPVINNAGTKSPVTKGFRMSTEKQHEIDYNRKVDTIFGPFNAKLAKQFKEIYEQNKDKETFMFRLADGREHEILTKLGSYLIQYFEMSHLL